MQAFEYHALFKVLKRRKAIYKHQLPYKRQSIRRAIKKKLQKSEQYLPGGFQEKLSLLSDVPPNVQILPLLWPRLFSFNIVVTLCMKDVPLL